VYHALVKPIRCAPTHCILTVAILVALAWLPLRGQQRHNLDALDDATLDRELEAELDDIYEDLPPDALAALDAIEEDMIDALSNDGDDGNEDDIDEEDLENEVEEAGLSIPEVIERGLRQADQLASAHGPRTWVVARVSAVLQRGDGRTTPRLAVAQVKRSFETAIRQVRRE